MYETFFSCIGIFIGFLQAAIFQFTFDNKPKSKEKARSLRIIYVVQELLLLSFFVSLIYIYFFGTYIFREPSQEALSNFMKVVVIMSGISNTFILVCIAAIFNYNLYLFLLELKCEQKYIWIILAITIISFVLSIICTIRNEPAYYFENASTIEPLITGNHHSHISF